MPAARTRIACILAVVAALGFVPAVSAQVVLPEVRWGKVWCRVLDTERGFAVECGEGRSEDQDRLEAGAKLEVLPRSMWVLRRES